MRKRLFFIILPIITITIVTIWIYNLPQPPAAQVNQARNAIAEADKSLSGKYSASLYKEAVTLYDSAMHYWKIENEKIFFNRKYSHIESLALRSEKKAILAKERSINNVASFQNRLGKTIKETDSLLKQYDQNFNKVPWPTALKKKEVRARLLFSEGKLAFDKKDYLKSAKCIDKATEQIHEVFIVAKNEMKNYFDNHPEWQQQVDNAIARSRKQNAPAIVVDKFAGKCYLYHSGKLISTWDAELGKNWIGDKKMKGDKATPEGNYYVTAKKSGRNTTYYKALLINYPNEEDKASFAAAKKKGQIPSTAGIGNNIEIHGGGGKGVHWTDGCVALSNPDMDKIYHQVTVGTPVTIVGSLRPFEEVFNF